MNSTRPASRVTPLFVVANECHTSNAEWSDFQELFSIAMDQAIGIEKSSLAAAVSFNSCVFEPYKSALWITPMFGNFLDTASQTVVWSVELQMMWLGLLAPRVPSHARKAASGSGDQAQLAADELSHSMDVATGERAA